MNLTLFTILSIFFLFSCSQTRQSSEDKAHQDSVLISDTLRQTTATPSSMTERATSINGRIVSIFTIGTYAESEIESTTGGEWFAILGKEGGISEIVKVQLNYVTNEPSEGEDLAPTIDVMVNPSVNPIVIFRADGNYSVGTVPGRHEEHFVEVGIDYSLTISGFRLRASGDVSQNEYGENVYENYSITMEKGDGSQELFSGLRFVSKHPQIIWSGDLNADGVPELLFQVATDDSDEDAYYVLWHSGGNATEFVEQVAEHKVYPGE